MKTPDHKAAVRAVFPRAHFRPAFAAVMVGKNGSIRLSNNFVQDEDDAWANAHVNLKREMAKTRRRK